MNESELRKIINRIDELSSSPMVYDKISKMLDDPKVSAYDLGKVVSKDSSLTAKLLKLVNSPVYGFPHKIGTIDYAVAILGFNAIKNLTLGTSVFDLFKVPAQFRDFFESLWMHSIGCAVSAKVIAKYIKYAEPEELFVIGLLHDIGKAVELQFFADDFIQVLEFFSKKDVSFNQAEQEVMGFDHTTIGKLLCQRWKFSRKLVKIIASHHSLDFNMEFSKELAVVHLADIFSRAMALGSGEDERVPPLDKTAWDTLGLHIGMIEPIMQETKRAYNEAVEFLLG